MIYDSFGIIDEDMIEQMDTESSSTAAAADGSGGANAVDAAEQMELEGSSTAAGAA